MIENLDFTTPTIECEANAEHDGPAPAAYRRISGCGCPPTLLCETHGKGQEHILTICRELSFKSISCPRCRRESAVADVTLDRLPDH